MHEAAPNACVVDVYRCTYAKTHGAHADHADPCPTTCFFFTSMRKRSRKSRAILPSSFKAWRPASLETRKRRKITARTCASTNPNPKFAPPGRHSKDWRVAASGPKRACDKAAGVRLVAAAYYTEGSATQKCKIPAWRSWKCLLPPAGRRGSKARSRRGAGGQRTRRKACVEGIKRAGGRNRQKKPERVPNMP